MNMLSTGATAPAAGSVAPLLAGAMTVKVTDVAQQCPGDVLTMDCDDMQYYNFDAKTSNVVAKVPQLKQDVSIKCTLKKTASNGDIEAKDVMIKYLATHPVCKIDTSKIPKTM